MQYLYLNDREFQRADGDPCNSRTIQVTGQPFVRPVMKGHSSCRKNTKGQNPSQTKLLFELFCITVVCL